MLRLNILLFLSLLYVPINCDIEEKLNVHLLYESLCPDSIRFVKEQLYPSWSQLAPYMNIIFVPFGKSASSQNGEHFVCQHGPKECLGNKIQSCALSALPDQTQQVEYVHCFMSIFKKNQHDKKEFGQRCANQVGLNWENVAACHDSAAGTALQLEAEKITAQFSPKFIPTIIFNGQYHQQVQDEANINFHAVACSFIKQFHPTACSTN